MERRAARHETRLSGSHQAAADTAFHAGQRVRTIEGLIGRILEVSESWAPGNTSYQVVLDNGMGGGTYLESQLRPVPEDYGGLHQAPANLPASLGSAEGETPEDAHTAASDYPEMGSVLHDHPDPAHQITVVGSAHTAVPFPHSQLKFPGMPLPHAEPCPTCGWHRGDKDPDSQFYHYRHTLQERGEYEPRECEHCGGDLNDREEHSEQHEQYLHEQDWYTDWDAEQPGDTLHRGIATRLPKELHDHIHDESAPVHERAHHLLHHILRAQMEGSPYGGLGNFWSDDADVSKSYAQTTNTPGRHSYDPDRAAEQTPVMLHVHTPSMEHIETDPGTLSYWGVHSYHKAGNREVPIQNQAPLKIKGISWAEPDHGMDEGKYLSAPKTPEHFEDDDAWTHHHCARQTCGKKPITARASLVTPTGATYADGADARDDTYNGDPGIGIYWQAPAQQQWLEQEGLEQPEMPEVEDSLDTPPPMEAEAARQIQIQRERATGWQRQRREDQQSEEPWWPERQPERRRAKPAGGGGEDEDDVLGRISDVLGEDGEDKDEDEDKDLEPVEGAYDQQQFAENVMAMLHEGTPHAAGLEDEDWLNEHMINGHGWDRDQVENADEGETEHQHHSDHAQPGQDHFHEEYHADFRPPYQEPHDVRRPVDMGSLSEWGPERNVPIATPGQHSGEEQRSDVMHTLSALAAFDDSRLREERSDRWHEYQGRYQPDIVHRGIHVRLPDHVRDIVHDESLPRADRAEVLSDHFSREGLGMHWTPHTNIAHRSIINAADRARGGSAWDDDNPEYSIDDYMEDHYHGEDDGEESAPTHTDVIFHARQPGQKNVVRNPQTLQEHAIGWQHSPDEQEVPLKPGAPVRLTGISWRPHEPDYPMEPYEHHDFDKPIRHTAKVPWTGHQRGELHSWQDGGPGMAPGDFVPSGNFTNKRPTYREPEAGLEPEEAPLAREEPITVKATSEQQWSFHLRQQHGWTEDDVRQMQRWGHTMREMHQGEHDAGIAGHTHGRPASGPGWRARMHEKELRDRFGRPVKPKADAPSAQPGRGGAEAGDPLASVQLSNPARVTDPESWSDRERQVYYSSVHAQAVMAAMADAAREPGDEHWDWPVARAEVTEIGTPLTQGSPKRQKKLALAMFRTAAASPAFRFEFTAAWRDVVAKAKRIRASGGVRITAVKGSIVIGQVRGDHDVYESGLQRYPGRVASIFAWSCGCPWASFHQDKDIGTRYAGRPCSHVYALQLEAGARTRFGRHPLRPDPAIDVPYAEVVTKSLPPWGPGGWRETWTAPATLVPVTSLKKVAVGADFQEPGDVYHHLEHDHQYSPEWLDQWSDEKMRHKHRWIHDNARADLGHHHNFFGRDWDLESEKEPEFSQNPDEYGGFNQNFRRDEPNRKFHRYQDIHELREESEPWEEQQDYHDPVHLSSLHEALFAEHGERDTCELCHQTIRKSTMDPANPWLHEHSGNAFCDVDSPGDAVGLAGLAGEGFERAEAKPMMFEGARTYGWDEIGEMHPSLYGDPEVHGAAAEGADGEGVGWAANQLANDRPEDPDAENSGAWDLEFHREHVPVKSIDYARAGADDPRVREARYGYESPGPEHRDWTKGVPPPILVHRHGVYQVADGHHRAEGADLAGRTTVRAYVHYSEHENEPFSADEDEGERYAPFHGAEPSGRRTAAASEKDLAERFGEEYDPPREPRDEAGGLARFPTEEFPEPGREYRALDPVWPHFSSAPAQHAARLLAALGEPAEDVATLARVAGMVHLEQAAEPLRNPHTGQSEWYHGSQAHKEDIAEHGLLDPTEFAPGRFEVPEGEGDDSGHWNRLLGSHFTADHDLADEFARGEHSGSSNEGYGEDREEHQGIVHAKLGIHNPKHYASEHDMDHEAYEHEHAAGNHPINHLLDYGPEGDEDADEERDEMWNGAMRIHRDFGKEKIPEGTYGHYLTPFERHPMRTAWLNTHPDKFNIAERFKQRLIDQGHDGVTYGNEYERSRYGRAGNTSAIAFHPHQVEITEHHHVDEDCRTEPHPHTAAANDPFGGENTMLEVPPKPYGATSQPQKDMDPGSYGPLAGPDPEGWGEIQDNSAIQQPLSTDAALEPGAEETAGAFSPIEPADPQGIRMEEAYGRPRDPWLDPPAMTEEDQRHAEQMSEHQIGNLDRTSDAYEHIWGWRQERPHELQRKHKIDDDDAREYMHGELAKRGHDMQWHYHDEGHDPPEGTKDWHAPQWQGHCKDCGANTSVGWWGSSVWRGGKDARNTDCSGPGTAHHDEMMRELQHQRFQTAIGEYGQAVKDIHDKEWLRGQGFDVEGMLWPETTAAGTASPHDSEAPQLDGAIAAELKDEPEGALDEEGLTADGNPAIGGGDASAQDKASLATWATLDPEQLQAVTWLRHSHTEAPTGEPGEDAASYQHMPYIAPPRSGHELMGHLGAEHGIGFKGDRAPADRFLIDLHYKFHDGVLPDRRTREHQHEVPEGHDPVFGARDPDEQTGAHVPVPGSYPLDGSATGGGPGLGHDEDLSPAGVSIQSMGNQQWSGGDYSSGDVAAPELEHHDSEESIVAAFQRSAAARQFADGAPGGAQGASDADLAAAARAYLSKTADALPEAEASALIAEGRGERARNLDLLDLKGTHYEDEDEELKRKGVSLDDFDDDVVSFA